MTNDAITRPPRAPLAAGSSGYADSPQSAATQPGMRRLYGFQIQIVGAAMRHCSCRDRIGVRRQEPRRADAATAIDVHLRTVGDNGTGRRGGAIDFGAARHRRLVQLDGACGRGLGDRVACVGFGTG